MKIKMVVSIKLVASILEDIISQSDGYGLMAEEWLILCHCEVFGFFLNKTHSRVLFLKCRQKHICDKDSNAVSSSTMD